MNFQRCGEGSEAKNAFMGEYGYFQPGIFKNSPLEERDFVYRVDDVKFKI